MSQDIKLNRDTHDIELGYFDFQLTQGVDTVAQQIKIRLETFLTEWFLDTSAGLPYHQEIFSKGVSISRVDSLIKDQLATTPHVTELLAYQSVFISNLRALIVAFKVRTDFGDLQMELKL